MDAAAFHSLREGKHTRQDQRRADRAHDVFTPNQCRTQAVSRWFRFYADAMRNPKVAALSDHDFRLWVELLAIASENDGHIPPLESLKYVLKRRLDHLSRGLNGLIRALLIDALSDGYEPHNWSKFQYKSDVSTDRVNKHRAKRNVSETVPEQKQSRTDIPTAKAIGIARRERAHAMPTDWEPILTPAAQRTVDGWPPGMFQTELAKFHDHASDKGRTSKDWQAGFRTWIANAEKWSKPNGSQNIRNGSGNGHDKRSSLARAIDEGIEFLGTGP